MQHGDPDHGGWLAPSTRRPAPVLIPVSLPVRLTQRTRAQPVNAGPKGAPDFARSHAGLAATEHDRARWSDITG